MSLLSHVTNLINDKGKTLTLRKVTEGTYNPATGSVSNTTADTSTYGMMLNFKDQDYDGTIIQRSDRKVVLRVDGVVPEIQDQIIEGGDTYRVLNVRTIEEAGTDIVYILHVRK